MDSCGGPNVGGGGGGGIWNWGIMNEGGGGGGGSGFEAGGEMMIILEPFSDFLANDDSIKVTTRMRINRNTKDRDMTTKGLTIT